MGAGEVSRIETGVVQFDDDWPGVFIRGDNALYYAMLVRRAVESMPNGLVKSNLKGLADLLDESRVRGPESPVGTQHVKRA